MDWKKELFSYRKYTDDIEYNGERVSIEDLYQEFKKRLFDEAELVAFGLGQGKNKGKPRIYEGFVEPDKFSGHCEKIESTGGGTSKQYPSRYKKENYELG